eukprot:CAMPEP_0201552236 /NCGR_PEP_ID=MMETSP0173_2-20130828/14571_1 /ASSEMBLY_ACC=CAM_ASM_000268 /TAXON_ID=218659 /ORGANISM="Vexillifera sp., Strain DIVA3 564/2" /LENGTH=361 /DNA_ID=CAMNT_0047962679 /DNA_START=128 /DNA_END=1210 /DNA_ORIENTATION=+
MDQVEKIMQICDKLALDVHASSHHAVDILLHEKHIEAIGAYADLTEIMLEDIETSIHQQKKASSRDDGFFSSYHTYDEINEWLEKIEQQYPQITSQVTIGHSVEGRPIKGIIIGSSRNGTNPGIFYNSLQHAREWISGATTTYIINQLVSGYGKNETVTAMVDNIEWTIIPVANPDGYNYTWTTNRMWRKNRRHNGGAFDCYGVDNNRNWGFEWNVGGASNNPCVGTYAGPFAFSEPEDKALADYASNNQNLRAYIDFHAYSQLWMDPWAYTDKNEGKTPAYDQQESLASEIASAIFKVHGKTYETGPAASVIYVASGSSMDFTYGQDGITYSYAVELRDKGRYGFLLPPEEIIPQGQEIW